MLDIADIPCGMLALDLLVKEAYVDVLSAGTVQAGRYLILFGGAVEPVQLSFERAIEGVGQVVNDSVLLPWAEERLVPAIMEGRRRTDAEGDAIGVLHNGTAPTMLRALDAALKGALVDLIQLRVAEGLAGAAIATLRGTTHDVEAALEIAEDATRRCCVAGWSTTVIRNVDDEVAARISRGSHFFQEWRG